MANITGGLQGAQQGAQLGSMFGPWGTVIGAGVGAIFGLGKDDPAKAALEAQRKFNAEVVKNTVTDLFDQERSQQVERMRTARALQSYQAQGKTQISTVRAGYGAADLIGASAQALSQAIDYQTNQALEATRFNYAVGFENYLTGINQTTNKGVNSLQRSIDLPEQKPMDIMGMFNAGKSVFGAGKQLVGQAQSTSFFNKYYTNTGSGQYISGAPSNLGLTFKGF